MADDDERGGNSLLSALAHPSVLNPLAAYGDAARTANSIWANREWQAKQAAGEAAQGAIGPDGTYSVDKYRQNLQAQGPTAALAAQAGLNANQQISADQLAQVQKKVGWVNAASGAALQSGDYSDSAMLKLFQDGMANNMLTLPEVQKQIVTVPPDAAGRQRWLQQHQMTAASTQQQLDQTYGTRPQVNTGGDIQFPVVPPASAGGKGPVITATPSPETMGTPVKWTDNQGVEHNTTWAEYNQARGNGMAASPPTVAPGAPPGTGRPPPLVPQRLTDTTGPVPGTAEAGQETARQSAQLGGSLVTRADQVPQNKANYGNMLSDLSKLDTMGPGTSREAAINGIVQKLTGYGITMNRDQVAGAESFSKIANMIAAQQLGSLGPTDARQSLAMGANPHLDLSKLGNTQIIHMLQGNEDAINAKSRAWQNWIKPVAQGGLGNNTASYGQFSTDFNHNFDPRVFQQQYMGPSEIADLRKSLSGPGEAQKFKQDYLYAKKQGWIK